jgi:hypothetical protein
MPEGTGGDSVDDGAGVKWRGGCVGYGLSSLDDGLLDLLIEKGDDVPIAFLDGDHRWLLVGETWARAWRWPCGDAVSGKVA